jgi:hypothetical protein
MFFKRLTGISMWKNSANCLVIYQSIWAGGDTRCKCRQTASPPIYRTSRRNDWLCSVSIAASR